ncbi:MAG: hypothetical protein IJX17_06805 [Clostridia bacterium]|nr:hypothetical protein [Clostridia bacterium]
MTNFENGLNLSKFYKKETKKEELKIIDIDEFRDLQIEDYSVYDNICNDNYNNIFKFETNSGDYSLHFEKVLHYYGKNKYVELEYVVFKVINYTFNDEYTPIYNNLIIYDISDDHTTLTLIEDEDIIQDFLEETQLIEYIDGLKVIDIDEFKELNIDYSILDCIKDDNYNNIFNFETASGEYSLKFEKVFYNDSEYFEFVMFKPLNHIYIEIAKLHNPNNIIIYSIDDDSKLTLVEEDDVVLDLINDYYINPDLESNLESDNEEDNDFEVNEEDNGFELQDNNSDDDNDVSDDNNDDESNNYNYDENELFYKYFDQNDDLYYKLFDDNYNRTLVVKTHEGKTIIYKKIGKVDYKKTTYFIMQFLDKFSKKEKYDYIVYKYENSNLATVFKKRLHKKILKIYSKQHKVKLK